MVFSLIRRGASLHLGKGATFDLRRGASLDQMRGASLDPGGGEEAGMKEDELVEEETANRRYPARARRAPEEWYRANVAVETGEHS